ncbi:MAG: flippase-like domain-containing protein [Clostridia bacterium]|nr:flippase-like domain-containing protein [Clostridia bacterium]
MKKMSRHRRSALVNALVIIGTLGIVLYLGSRDGGLNNAWNTMRSADWRWLLAAVGSWLVFMIFEGMGLHVFFHYQDIRIRFGTSFLVALIGAFYSAVTPAATGGQPMQVIALKKRGIPAGISSSGLAVKFFTFQTALLSLGGLLWLTNADTVRACVAPVGIWFVILGFFLNGLTVVAVVLLAINKNIVKGILSLTVRLAKKLRLVKNEARLNARMEKAMADFHASVELLKHHPGRLLNLYLISCLQVLGLMSITYCIYRSLGMQEMSYLGITTLQFLLYIGASFTPLPGASGAQEEGFDLVFGKVFRNMGFGAQLMWRFFTYYITLIIGLGAVIVNSAGSIRQASQEAEAALSARDDAPEEENKEEA